jgi:hypothetical protein
MVSLDITQFGKSGFVSLGSAAVSPIALESDGTVRTMSRFERRKALFRKRQVAKGWSTQQRADRLRAGIASRAWLFNSIAAT